MSNTTTVEYIQKYVKNKYDLNFKLDKSIRWLTYSKGKINYSFYCQYVWDDEEQVHNWCICCDLMDKNQWYGYDMYYIDNGDETIDYILKNEFHLINDKLETQLSLF